MEHDFNNIDFNNLSEAAVHFEVDEGDYLTADILKFGLKADGHFVVIDADTIRNYPELVKWLEDKTRENWFMTLRKHMLKRID